MLSHYFSLDLLVFEFPSRTATPRGMVEGMRIRIWIPTTLLLLTSAVALDLLLDL